MARHNRLGRGTDQRGSDYAISFQPDWLDRVKVTRTLATGRQSTKTLFRNPEPAGRKPGPKVRTRIVSRAENLDIEIGLSDPHGVITRILVETNRPDRPAILLTVDGRARRRPARKRKH